jgi:hypothetical protein
MTFDQARAAGRVAICHLPGGVQLRYDPADGSIRSLPYPGMPHQWREASTYLEPPPHEGWEHYRGCGCSVCAADDEVVENRERASA